LYTDTGDLHDVSAYHFDGAGKYFRPMVVLLAAKACNLHSKTSSFRLVENSAMKVMCIAKFSTFAVLFEFFVV